MKMKHCLLSYVIAIMNGAIMLASCCNEVEEKKKICKQQMTFSASYENNICSRTSLGPDLSVLWAANDALSVFDDSNNNEFSLISGEGKSTALFKGVAEVANKYYAVYPYQSDASISGNMISDVEIPAEQKANANTFDPKANVMTAASNSANDFAFKNVCSYAKITTTNDCKRIIFTAGSGDNIAGKFNLTVAPDGVSTVTPKDCVNKVTLVPAEGTSFGKSTYYIAIKAGDISSLMVQCVYTDKILERFVPSKITIFTRNSVIDLGTAATSDGWLECLCPDENHPHAVDLGISTKWACMNIGAQSPIDYGTYYSWGEVTGCSNNNGTLVPTVMDGYSGSWGGWANPNYVAGTLKTNYGDWSYYKWCQGTGTTLSKYCSQTEYGKVDDKVVLDDGDDAAKVNWGNDWAVPSGEEMDNLLSGCYWVWTNNYHGTGVPGRIGYAAHYVEDKGKNSSNYTSAYEYNLKDNHIFLPAAGFADDNSFLDDGLGGYYWTAKGEPLGYNDISCRAYIMAFYSDDAANKDVVIGTFAGHRFYGHPVRAVYH